MLMVRITPNQIGSKPAPMMMGIRIGVVIKMIAAGGRNMPATSSITLIASRMIQRLTCISPIAVATDCVTCSDDIM